MYEIFEQKVDNEEIYQYWLSLENIAIEKTGGTDRAIIFFTGHGLYFPTTIEAFRQQVKTADKYEYKNLSHDVRLRSSVCEFIFVRDVYKNWCIQGINGAINTQDKLMELLKERVGNREVITVGSSAGGYLAILYGLLLDAKAIYAFSPQISLFEYHKDHPIKYYEEYSKTPQIAKYMNLTTMISEYKGDLFYWYPALCSEDVRQYEVAKCCDNVNFFAMKQSKHGNTLWGESMIMSLIISSEKLKELSIRYQGRIISPFKYCCRTSGIFKAAILFGGKNVKRLLKK